MTTELGPAQPSSSDPADYGPVVDDGLDPEDATCRTCRRPATEHTRGRYSIFGVCPPSSSDERPRRYGQCDDACTVDCGPHDAAETSKQFCVLRHPRKPALASVGLICDHHAAALNEALQDILELWALSALYLTPGDMTSWPKPDKGAMVKSADAPAPGSVHIMSLRDARNFAPRPPGQQLWFQETDDIIDPVGTLRDLARDVADARHITDPDLSTITTTVTFLRTHRDWIAGQSWITDYDDTLYSIRKALSLGRGGHSTSVGSCPTLDGAGQPCGGPLWADPYGPLQVTCGRCDRAWDERMLRHLGETMTA